MHQSFTQRTSGQGLYEVTGLVQKTLDSLDSDDGLCTVFIQHTSASLVVQENADPSARADLEMWLKKLVPQNDPDFTHIHEGPDDMPSHIKAVLTQTSISIPVISGRLGLGTWQGIYVWEHRDMPHNRNIMVTYLGATAA